MPNTPLERDFIRNVEDIANGAGLDAKIKVVKVGGITAGRHYGADGENTGYMSADVSIEIEYAAGYRMGGDYVYRSKNNIADTHVIDNLVQYAKEGNFELDIKYLKEDYLPFKNWWIEVDSEEALLDEILEVGRDPYGDDDDSDNDVGNAFSFSFDESCREVAYKMLANLSLDEGCDVGSVFTDDFVAEIDNRIRQAMIEHLTVTS